MKKLITILLVLFLMGFLPTISIAQENDTTVLNFEVKEAYTINSNPEVDTTSDNVSVGYDNNGFIRRTLLRLDLSRLPDNIDVISATMNIDIENCNGDNIGSINAARIVSEWDPEELTWQNRPGFSSPRAITNLDCLNSLAVFDLTELIEGISNGDYENNGVIIYGPDQPGTAFFFRSFDLESVNSFLEVEFEVNETNTETEEAETSNIFENRTLLLSALAITIVILITSIIVIIVILTKKNKKSDQEKDSKNTEDNKDEKNVKSADDEDKDKTTKSEKSEDNKKSKKDKSKRITMNKKKEGDKNEKNDE